MNYFISDLHYGHEKCIGFDNRPFSSVEEMNNGIVSGITSVVSSEDDLYILGDMAMKVHLAIELLGRLAESGVNSVHLIKGNHDNVAAIQQAHCKNLVEVLDYKKMQMSTQKYPKLSVALCHYPMLSWDKQMYGGILLYGHIHIQPMFYFENGEMKALYPENLPNAYNCLASKFNFVPQTLDQILETYGYNPNIYREFL